MIKKVVYPGTFDPLTNGHLDIIQRVANLFDHVVLGVAASPSKKTMFTLEERVEQAIEVTKHLPNVSVKGFSGLLIDFVKQEQADVLIRGLRTTIDFEYEFGLTNMYRHLQPNLESIFLTPTEQYMFLSSTIVREVAIHGGDIRSFVPKFIAEAIEKKVQS